MKGFQVLKTMNDQGEIEKVTVKRYDNERALPTFIIRRGDTLVIRPFSSRRKKHVGRIVEAVDFKKVDGLLQLEVRFLDTKRKTIVEFDDVEPHE